MTDDEAGPGVNGARVFDLEQRTAAFAEAVILHLKPLRSTAITRPLISQLVRSATSIDANYCKANDAESKRDSRHKIGLCRKESKETMYWLRMLVAAEPNQREGAKPLWREARELNRIFGAIRRNTPTS